MKKAMLLLIVAFLALFAIGCAQEVERSESLFDSTKDNITLFFRDYYENNNNYAKKESDILGLSSEGGIVEGFFDGNELRRLRLSLLGSMGRAEYDYYLIDSQTIYVISKVFEYDRPFFENPSILREYSEEFFIIGGSVKKYSLEVNDLLESEDDERIYSQFSMAKEQILAKIE